MLNKEKIMAELNNLNLPRNKFVVLSGASMVIQGLKKETSDIDISISKDLEKELVDFQYHLGLNNQKIYEKTNFELFNTYYDETEYIEIDRIRFATIESVFKLKKQLNRKKDQDDIKKLDLFLCLKDNKRYEKELHKKHITLIAGVDEVGRGPLVGPVVAAAVILPIDFELKGLTDSKKLSEKKRNEFDIYIKENCLSYGIGVIDNDTIDDINILEATKLAMKKAVDNLNIKPEHVLVDAMKMDFGVPSTAIIKGDMKSISISAASVIAKVYRDNLMYELDKKYPYYNYKKNKGYPTKEHLGAIKKHGITKEYRKSYGPVKECI